MYGKAFHNASSAAPHLKRPKSWKKLDLSQIGINNWDSQQKKLQKVGKSWL